MSDWQDRAACKKAPELYYDSEGEKPPEKVLREARAKAICESCPVLLPCRGYALGRPEQYGFWAALSEDERKALRKASRRRERERGAA